MIPYSVRYDFKEPNLEIHVAFGLGCRAPLPSLIVDPKKDDF